MKFKRTLDKPDYVIVKGGTLAAFEYGNVIGIAEGEVSGENPMDMERMLARLRENPLLAAELLSYDGHIYYMGDYAMKMGNDGELRGETLGMKFVDGGTAIEGSNLYGDFLMKVRNEYRAELASKDIEEAEIRPGQIVKDFTLPNQEQRETERQEVEEGKSFLHTEPYSKVAFKRNASKNGTTGYAERESVNDVSFQTFECPFGTDYNSKIRVGSAAETSFLYEKALRGELDIKSMVENLKGRGLIKNITSREEETLIMDIHAQFAWMKEQICRDNRRLASQPIVTDLSLVSDASFGRSIYDPHLAPSPAHILARYINNPLLFFSNSTNSVITALENGEKNEPSRISAISGKGRVTILVDGSETIGGRMPSSRGIKVYEVVYLKDENGNFVKDAQGRNVPKARKEVYKYQFKSKEETEFDYLNFSRRLDTILANISPEIEVEFVTGTAVGTGRMVERYIQEHQGASFTWNYETGKMVASKMNKELGEKLNSHLSLVKMPYFDKVFPALVGMVPSVEFNAEEDGVVRNIKFDSKSISGNCLVEFTVDEDRKNKANLEKGSLAFEAGLPVIHVQNNALESEQMQNLSFACDRIKDTIIGEQTYGNTLFGGEARVDWDMKDSNVFGFIDDNGNAYPEISYLSKSAVYVGGTAFHSVYSAYAALLVKNVNPDDVLTIREIANNENSLKFIADIIAAVKATDSQKENCIRNAVHLMALSNAAFVDRLINLDNEEIVCPNSFGDSELFVDAKGNGQNRFGIALTYERDLILAQIEEQRKKAEEQRMRIAEENLRLQKKANTQRAEGQKMADGLPSNIKETEGAVWFLGANRPLQLSLPEGNSSFMTWEETEYGKDTLNREIAARQLIDDDNGGFVENRYVFLFPSDVLASTGRRYVKNFPNSKNLTGLRRVNPATGEEFTCAFGIPVKKDDESYERDNKLGYPCSYLSDRDVTDFINNIIATDALARTTAMKQNMGLCLAVRARDQKVLDTEKELDVYENFHVNDDISRVFLPKVWDYPHVPEEPIDIQGKRIEEELVTIPDEMNLEDYMAKLQKDAGKPTQRPGDIALTKVTKKVYNHETQSFEFKDSFLKKKDWVDNPHSAPMLRKMVKRYESLLVEGSSYPLNCICMPKAVYGENDEEKFLADFSFALSVANATAISLGVPMRFPLDENGKLYLGDDVPEKFRDIAERKLNSFINVVKEDQIINGPLPQLTRIPMAKSYIGDEKMQRDGTDLYIRPNDLMLAFGPYDFTDLETGVNVPVHEMAFRMEDGSLFRVTDPRNRSRLSLGEISRYMRYEKNDECRFTVRSYTPEKIPQFVTALRSYIERAKRVTVETRFYSETEALMEKADLEMDGFFELFSTNRGEMTMSDYEVSGRGNMTSIEMPNRFDGNDNENEYYGKVDAKDGFTGWVQYKYTLPDGTKSDWVTVKDRSLAASIALSSLWRDYRSDKFEAYTPLALKAVMTSLAIQDAGDKFCSLTQEEVTVTADDRIFENEKKSAVTEKEEKVEVKENEGGRVFVTYYGSHSVPKDSMKVQISTSCPEGMKDDFDVEFKTIYPDYKTMVGPHKEGKIDDAEYTRRYTEQVLEPNKEKILAGMKELIEEGKENGKDIYLFCYCAPGQFCHRYLVNNFLNENGIACQENPNDRKLYRTGHVALYGEPVANEEKDLFSKEEPSVEEKGKFSVTFTESNGGYQMRTRENAAADDVDFTLQFAVDFDTYGEKATARAAGDSLISIEIPNKDGKLILNKESVAEVSQAIINCLPEDFVNGEPFGVNIAGNGIYTLAEMGATQKKLDDFMTAVSKDLKGRGITISSFRSGGQTGIDETAVAMAKAMDAPVTIHAPKNWVYRGENGKDVYGEESFKKRFAKYCPELTPASEKKKGPQQTR